MAEAKLTIEVDAKDAERSLSRFADSAERATKGLERSFGAVKAAAGAALAFIAGRAVVGAMGDFVRAAQEQEQALQNVATALARTGEFSRENLADVEAFASGLQELKGVSDDAALGAFALAKSFGASNEQAKKAVDAAAELAAATGKGLDESIRKVSKTFGGMAGELGEVNPAIKALTEQQLKAGAAAEVLLKQFGGTAASQLNTFTGAVTKTRNAFGDLQESIGAVFTQNSAVVGIVKGFGEAFKTFDATIKGNQGGLKKFVAEFALGFAKQVPPILVAIDTLIKSFDILSDKKNTVRSFFDTVALSISFVTDEALALTETLLRIEKFAAKFAPKGSPLNPLGGFGAVGNGQQGPAGTKIGDDQLLPAAVDNAAEAAKAVRDLEERIASLQKLREENRKRALDVGDGGAGFAEGSRSPADSLLLKLADGFQDVIEGIQKSLAEGGVGTPAPGSNVRNQAGGAPAGTNPFAGQVLGPGIELMGENLLSTFDLILDRIEGTFHDAVGSFVANIFQGEAGARRFVADTLKGPLQSVGKVVGGLGDALAESVGGPLGKALSGIFGIGGIFGTMILTGLEVLGQDPETFGALIDAFVDNVPRIIDNIVANIPTLMIKVAENLGPIITALLAAVPRIVVAFAEAMPYVAFALVESFAGGISYQLDKFSTGVDLAADNIQGAGERFSAWIDSLGEKLSAFGDNIGLPVRDAATDFYKSVVDAGYDMVKPLIEFFESLNADPENNPFSKVFGGKSPFKSGSSKKGPITGIRGSFLAKGGTIPKGFDRDTFSAFLSSGELVVPKDDVKKLREFIENFDKSGILRGQTGKRRKKLEAGLDRGFEGAVASLFGLGERIGQVRSFGAGSAAEQALALAGSGDVAGLRSLTSSLGLNDGDSLQTLKTLLVDTENLSRLGEDTINRLIKDVNEFNADKSNTEGSGFSSSGGVSSSARSFSGGGGSIVDAAAEELRTMRNQDAQAYGAIIQALQALVAQPTEVTSKVEFNSNVLADIILQLSRRNARTAA